MSDEQPDIPEQQRHELQNVAEKSTTTAVLLGIFISPLGYWYANENMLALINFLTLNYLLLGIIIVPIHSRKIILDAREELEAAGHSW